MQHFKTALFIENEDWRDELLIARIYDFMKHQGTECKIIDHAIHHANELPALINWAEAIFFQSTFMYKHQIHPIGMLFASIKNQKFIFGMPTSGTLQYHLEKTWKLEELIKFSQHKVFELLHIYPEEFNDWYKEVDMQAFVNEFKRLEKERYDFNHGFKKTGKKIRIKTLLAFGEQFSLLKKGMEVYELDCSSIDPECNRGIWVMGKDEPVKLINDHGADEWEFVDLDYLSLTYEIFSRACKLQLKDYMEIISDWIRKCTSPLQTEESELWFWVTNLCDSLDMPRRGNRQIIYDKLIEYGKKYHYFRQF